MTSSYDSTGITLDRYADILDRLITLSEAQWGDSINTDEDGYLGHTLRLVALILAEINQVVQSVYDAGSVSNSSGVRLGNLVELVGLSYQAAAYSTVTLQLTATKACTVPAGSQYATAADVTFATDSQLVFSGAGSDTVAATCTVTGANDAGIGTITTIKTTINGISAVTNTVAATPGRDQETAAELKARHTLEVATAGEDDAASIYNAVAEVTGVSAVYVFDNDTDAAIGVVPANTIRVSTVGGAAADVAEAISDNKTAGVPTYGATGTSVYNSTTKQAKTINHDTAVNTDTHISFTVTTLTGVFPDDGEAQLKAAIVEHYEDIGIDDDVIYNSLYSPIYSITGVISISLLKLDISDPPGGTSDLASSPLIRYTVDSGDIDVTVA
jgi:uncharacterized phage protein gp47/JayE